LAFQAGNDVFAFFVDYFMRLFSILVIIMLFSSLLLAKTSPGTVGFQFLRTQVGARPSAMSGAFIAIPNDVHCIYYNPAGLATFTRRSGSFSYLDHLLDINSGFIGFVQPQLGPGNLGVGILYMDYGSFKRTDNSSADLGSFGANSIAFVGSYAGTVSHNLFAGVSGKYIRATIDNYSSDAIAMDAGIIYALPANALTIGGGVFNLGQVTSAFVQRKDSLPFNYRVGIAKKLEHLPLLIAFNLYKYNKENWHGALGGEFLLSNSLLLRLGYDNIGKDLQVDSSKDTFAGASIGLGLLWSTIKIDYGYSSYGVLGSLNRFSVSGQF
jgi:hypothetical protein